MFNFKLKSLQEEVERLKKLNKQLHKKQFRVGDAVYVNDGRRDPRIEYFIRRIYNGGTHCNITLRPDQSYKQTLENAVSLEDVSPDPPATCGCCGALLNTEDKE